VISTFWFLFLFIIEGALVIDPETSTGIYAISFLPGYHALLLTLAALGIVSAMEIDTVKKVYSRQFAPLNRLSERLFQSTRITLSQWVFYLLFSIIVFFPVFKCYFQIPYLFCHVCPRKCPFGFLRPYLIPAALIMNLTRRAWCFRFCPLGTLQSCYARSVRSGLKTALQILALAVLGITAYSYFKISTDAQSAFKFNNDWYISLFRNSYDVSVWVLGGAAVLLLITIFLPRLFCRALCPVGNLSALIQFLEKRTERKLQSEDE
jgi:hypothetical protein